MEAHLTVIGRREHAIEHDDVEVGVEGGSDPMEKRQRPKLSAAGCIGARAAQGGADRTDGDPQDRA